MAGKNFVDYVQAHERMWGQDSYPDKPALNDILNARVVAFWIDANRANGKKHIITLHDNLEPIQDYLQTMVRRLAVSFPSRRLAFLFADKQEIELSIKLVYRPAKSQDV